MGSSLEINVNKNGSHIRCIHLNVEIPLSIHYSNGTTFPIDEDRKCKSDVRCYYKFNFIKKCYYLHADDVTSEIVFIKRVNSVFGHCELPDDVIGVLDEHELSSNSLK